MKCAPFQSPSTRKPRREFCGLNRASLTFPLTVLLYGMFPKFEPMPEPPEFLSRHTNVASINPMGTMQVLPSRMKAGAGPSGTASQGLVAAPAGACGCTALRIDDGRGAIAEEDDEADGITGVALATSPKVLRGTLKSWDVDAWGVAVPLKRSSSFF